LYPENIELLYSLVGIGEDVQIINEPYLAGYVNGEIYFESHPPLEDDLISPEDHLQKVFAAYDEFSDAVAQGVVRAIATDAKGVPLRIRSGDALEVFERARLVRNTVEQDPDELTLAEARAILDEPEAE
jgi:L,D-transpeptidase ErfK/SrfK